MRKIGFIGSGNMGNAMILGALASKVAKASDIIVSDLDKAKLEQLKTEQGVNVTTSANEVTAFADIIILAVKPDIYGIVMDTIKPDMTADKIIVTIAAGKTIKDVCDVFGESTKVVRTMPNTPALIGMGMTALCPSKSVTDSELAFVLDVFNGFSRTELIPEKLFDCVTGISGSSPAYAFMFIEALADAAVLYGMPRASAYTFASTALMGSAKMVLETGKHPGELKDMVCSPKGSTIEAVRTLENCGFRSAVINGVSSCIERLKEMTETGN